MVMVISIVLATLALLLAIPVAIFAVEVVAGVVLQQSDAVVPPRSGSRQLRVAVLVPAHNESVGLLPTLRDINAQLRASDRLLVVADNCADDTAAVAAGAGAEVIVRDDHQHKGKGYALACGLSYLSSDPPDIVIMIDSDCRVADAAIDQLASVCAIANRPVQALYLMLAPNQSAINYRVAEFAWRIKNWVRPLGLRALGLPCQLMGTGMAFRWEMLRSVDLANGSIVEDIKLGIDLALSGHPPVFSPLLGVTSYFPTSAEGIQTQRMRWEEGHLGMIVAAAPRLIAAAARRRESNLLAMALDLAVPPLSLLAMLTAGMLILASLSTWLGVSSVAMIVSATAFIGFLAAVLLSWLQYGHDIIPPRAILSITSYAFKKLPIYRQIVFRRSGSGWIRTDRRK